MTEAPPSTLSTEGGVLVGRRHGVEDIAHLEAHRLHHRPGQVGAVDPPAEPDDGPSGIRVPVGAPETGERRHEDGTLAGFDRSGQRLEVRGRVDDADAVT